jgi:hypothetical protein
MDMPSLEFWQRCGVFAIVITFITIDLAVCDPWATERLFKRISAAWHRWRLKMCCRRFVGKLHCAIDECEQSDGSFLLTLTFPNGTPDDEVVRLSVDLVDAIDNYHRALGGSGLKVVDSKRSLNMKPEGTP